jgi:membrane fusion protein, multidrug efflux system
MKRILVVCIAFVLGAGPLVLGACKGSSAGGPEGAPSAGGGGRRGGRGMGGEGGIAFAVETLTVESKKLDYVVQAPGTLDAFERVQVTARVAGVVDRVAFSEGQQVKKGDALVVIDSERFRLAVNSSKAALEKTQAALKDVEGQVARREGAMDKHPGLIPGEELESFRTKALTAKADTAVAQENLKIAELNLRDSTVRAPLEGVIQTRTVETGQYVNAGYVMATLLRSEPMLLRFQVEPSEAPRIKPEMKATFTLRETQRTFNAKITLVAGAADPTTHMVGITAQVEADDHKYWLRPGSFCDVSIDIGASREAPVIPRGATRATDHGYVVYVVENGLAKEKVITLGMSSKDGWVEVRSGLAAGEALVVRGVEALTPGAKVRATRVTSIDGGTPVEDDDDKDDKEGAEGKPRGDGGRRSWPAGSGSGGRRKRERGAGSAEGAPSPP